MTTQKIDIYKGIQKLKPIKKRLLHNARIRFRYAEEYPLDDRVDLSEEDIANLCRKLDYWSEKLADEKDAPEPAFILMENYKIFGIIRKEDYKGNYRFEKIKEDLESDLAIRVFRKAEKYWR